MFWISFFTTYYSSGEAPDSLEARSPGAMAPPLIQPWKNQAHTYFLIILKSIVIFISFLS